MKTRKKPKKHLHKVFYVFFIFAFFLAILNAVLQSDGNSNLGKDVSQTDDATMPNKEDEFLISDYSLIELLKLEGHPHIFDNWDEACNFYTKVLDSRIQMTDTQTLSSMQMRQKNRFDDKVLLYLVQSSSGKKDTIGYISMNLFDEDFTKSIGIEDVVDFVVEYLPLDFEKYYKLDAAYTTTSDSLNTYVYACRLTDSTLDLSVSEVKHCPSYYNFKIYHYTDNNCWWIETGYSAYGGKSLDWIEKFAEPWEIDLTQYFES